MHHAQLPGRFGIELRQGFDQSQGLVGDEQFHPGKTPFLEVPQEAAPALTILLGAFRDAQYLAITILVHPDGNEHRHILDLAAPASLSQMPSRWT